MSNISVIKKEPNQEIISCIENLLERAKKGEITNFAFAMGMTEGNMARGWAGSMDDVISLLGEIKILELDFAISNTDLNLEFEE